MNIKDLRVEFNLSETIAEKIRNFKEDRISKISSGETPVPLNEGAKVIIHLIPLNAFYPGQNHDIKEISNNLDNLRLINDNITGSKYNLDGLLTYSSINRDNPISYLQIFRNGIIESTDNYMLNQGYIPSESFENAIIESIPSYLDIQKRLNVRTPISIFLTFTGVKGYYMAHVPSTRNAGRNHVIGRDILSIPEFIIDKYGEEIPKALKYCIDMVWNACGYLESPFSKEEDISEKLGR